MNTCSWRQSAAPDKVSRKSMGRAGEAGSPGIRCHRPRRRAEKVRLREPECSAALNCFSRVQLYATLWTVARQAPLSMKVSRQEHWSGLPCSSPGDLSNPGLKPSSPALQVDSLPSEPPGKLKNTGVGSLSLLQGIFLPQESNQGLLQCRHIVYQLSH